MRAGTALSTATCILLLLGCCACTESAENAAPATETGAIAAMLHVALQDGFQDDAVVIRLGDEIIFDKDNVSTDTRISRADVVEVPLYDGLQRLSLSLPDRRITDELEVEGAGETVYVGVSVQNGTLKFLVSKEPFGYM